MTRYTDRPLLWRRGSLLLLLVAGVAAYYNSFSGPFIFDDVQAIAQNPHLRTLWPLWHAWSAPPYSTLYGRPIVSLSLALNYAVGGLRVWGYHAVNLCIHLLAGLVLFGVVRRTLLSKALRHRYGTAAGGLALAIALLWLGHPLQTESITYVIQRAESLMGLCFLLTLYGVIRGDGSPHRRRWHAAAIASCAVGMGSKEVMAAAPLVVLLYDRTFLSGSFQQALRRHTGLYVGLGMTWLILAGLIASSPRGAWLQLLLNHFTPWEFAAGQCGVILHYLRLAFWPHPLVLDYYDWPVASASSILIVMGLMGATAWACWRRPVLGFVGAWFFLILAPTSSIIPLADPVFEHRMYLPLAALVALSVIGGSEVLRVLLPRHDGLRRVLGTALVGAVGILLGTGTVLRNTDYRSELAIWSDTVAKRPHNPRAHTNLGNALAQQGKLDEAIAHYREALRLQPAYAEAHSNLGVVLAHQGQLPEAMAHYREALRLQPDYAEAHNNLGVAFARQGQLPEAIAHYTAALQLNPAYATAHQNLADALRDQGAGE